MQAGGEGGEVAVTTVGQQAVASRHRRQPGLGEAPWQQVGEDRAEAAPGRLRLGQGAGEIDAGGEIDVDRLARSPVGRRLQRRRAAQPSVGEQQVVDELGPARAPAGADASRQGNAGERGERLPGRSGAFEGNQGGPRLDDPVAEPAGLRWR